ncbi:MAG: 4-hydroxyphenylpyruvate dioxygenase [Candidatus Melainabacteria bacterium]
MSPHDFSASPSLPPAENPLGLRGIALTELTTQEFDRLHRLFLDFGFSRLKRHRDRPVHYYRQNDIHLLIHEADSGFARAFAEQHGSSVCGMAWWFDDAAMAFENALKRGAHAFEPGKMGATGWNSPTLEGIGGSALYLLDQPVEAVLAAWGFEDLPAPDMVDDNGFLVIDHLTNNVYKGTMGYWADFYKTVFGFREVNYFDIKGEKTGLTSFALQSPCGTFSIPVNEGNESRSQIEEYLREYRGAGVQHIAFATRDLLASLDRLNGRIPTLDIGPEYYDEAFQRVPQVTEDRDHIRRHEVLVDGNAEGYLLQIFTKNLLGPIFFEMIQRKNYGAFGEGNFTALFKSIERDQARRGVL